MPYDRTAFITRTPVESACFDFAASADQFVADKLFDPKPVTNAATKVPQFDTSKMRVVETQKGTNAEADKIDEQLFYRDITLEEHKLSSDINPRDARDADPAGQRLLSDARKAQIVTLGLLMKREAKAVTLATTSSNYPADLTTALSAGDRWDDTGDPEAQMSVANLALRNRCGLDANALLVDKDALDRMRLSQNIRSRTQYTNGGPIPDDILKSYFRVDHLFVGRARRDSSYEGVAASMAGFWGANAIAFVYNPSIDMENVSYGHMWWINTPFWSKTIIDEKRTGAAGPMRNVQVGTEYLLDKGMVVSASDSDFAAGYLFRTAVTLS